jgi:uncharacterized protein YgiM (DUF1202 family)
MAVAMIVFGAACGGDDTAVGDDTTAAATSSADTGSAETATDGATGGDTGSDATATADDATGDDQTGDPVIDPSIAVPDWVEVVGVAEALNVRAGPGASFDRVGRIPPGETLRVLGGARNGDGELWLQVEFGGAAMGWVFDEYTGEIARPTPTPLPTPTPVGTPTPLPVDTGDDAADGTALVVAAPDGLNLRSTPGLGGQVLRELDDGDRLTGTGVTRRADGRRWTEVTIDGVTGWVASEFVAPA